MRGRIRVLDAGSAGGVIHSDSGDSVAFEFSAVLAYDVAFLAVGRLVSFDLEGHDALSAVNVCLHRLQPPRRPASLRYVGFDQVKGIRSYRFERTAPGEDTQTVVVTTDIALFTRHRVPLQEGPGMCLRLLETEPATGESRFALTENALISFVAARLDAIKPRHVWRRPRPAASGLSLARPCATGR